MEEVFYVEGVFFRLIKYIVLVIIQFFQIGLVCIWDMINFKLGGKKEIEIDQFKYNLENSLYEVC